MLIRRELVQTSVAREGGNYFTRSEHGVDWDIVTDIPWVHEVCCSMLPTQQKPSSGASVRPSTVYSTGSSADQVDQLYELLSEVQTSHGVGLELQKTWKVARRGIHLHVQYRDVHGPEEDDCQFPATSHEDPLSSWFDAGSWYVKYPYTERYLSDVHPRDDLNVWDDGLDWNHVRTLPPRREKSENNAEKNVQTWQRTLLAQEEPEEALMTQERQLLQQHLRRQTTGPSISRKRASISTQDSDCLKRRRTATGPNS
ncbi:F-box only protein 38 [Cichlidogyrus casuarinus]|uniref:F-box only protein 38 n=1 Tax=Cichlidogyrus casuarinus TaxID=1844966 RepID=A0ABD2QJN7_9PLAT